MPALELPSLVMESTDVGTLSDAELASRYFTRGDHAAVEALFLRHAHLAYRVALAEIGNAADAEDVVQAAFMQFLVDKNKDIQNVRGWIMKTVVHEGRDKLKAEARRRKRQDASGIDPASTYAPDDQKTETITAAVNAVKALPKDYRLPVWLHHLEGIPFKEIGHALSLPDDTVRKRASLGIDQVRQTLAAAGFTAVVVPELLASASLPAAPIALTASFKTMITGAGAKGAVAATTAAMSIKVAITVAVLLIAAGVVTIAVLHGGNRIVETRADGDLPVVSAPVPTPVAPVTAKDAGDRIWLNVLSASCRDAANRKADSVTLVSVSADAKLIETAYYDGAATKPLIRHPADVPLGIITPKDRKLADDLPYGKLTAPATGRPVLLLLESIVNGDDRAGGPVTLSRQGNTFHLVVEEWRSPNGIFNHNVPVNRCHVLELGTLAAGAYELQIERRVFNERGQLHARYQWDSVTSAPVAFNVVDGAAEPVESVLEWKSGALPAEAKDTRRQLPAMLAYPVYPGFGNNPLPKVGLSVGAFDFSAWAKTTFWELKNLPVLGPAKKGQPVYASIVGPRVNSDEYMTLREVRWSGTHATLVVELWRDTGDRIKNIPFFPALLVPLDLRDETNDEAGEITVSVEWVALRAKVPNGAYARESNFNGTRQQITLNLRTGEMIEDEGRNATDMAIYEAFMAFVSKSQMSSNDDDYKRLVGRGVVALPELKRIAVDKSIKMHQIAFTIIGDIGDRSAIPFLMKNIDATGEWNQTHVVWGLNALLNLGSFQENDTAEKKSEIVSKYKDWYRKAEAEFQGPVAPKSPAGDF